MTSKDYFLQFLKDNRENIAGVFKIPTKLVPTYYVLYKKNNLKSMNLIKNIGLDLVFELKAGKSDTIRGLRTVGIEYEIPT